MAIENGWRARRIQGELSKLGIRVSLATISRYLPRAKPDPGRSSAGSPSFAITETRSPAMDFFVVPTIRFQLLYVWFAIDHGRRRVFAFNVTASPTGLTVRRELLDHVVVLHEAHLRRLLREYIEYYNADRVHSSIGDAPEGRAIQARPTDSTRVTRLPRAGGLHGHTEWREAA